MKRSTILLLFILMITLSFSIFAESEATVLETTETLDSKCCYISGDFYLGDFAWYEAKWFTYIHIRLTNLDTKLSYDVPLNREHQYYYYELPEGKYQIDSFHLIYPRSTGRYFQFEHEDYRLSSNPELQKEFQLKAGEILYLGDYIASYIKSKYDHYSLDGFRTAKISLYPNFDKFTEAFKGNEKINHQFTIRTLDIKEIVSKPVDSSTPDENAIIAGRFFLNYKKDLKLKITLLHLASKKRYEIKFIRQSQIQYVNVIPGEYYVETIYFGGMYGYREGAFEGLIPRELMFPFVIKPNELCYLGNIGIEFESDAIRSMYINDWEVAELEIKEYLGDKPYTIVPVNDNK